MDKNKLIIENKRRIEAMANKLKAEYSLSDDMVLELFSNGVIYLWNKRRAFLKRLESRCGATLGTVFLTLCFKAFSA